MKGRACREKVKGCLSSVRLILLKSFHCIHLLLGKSILDLPMGERHGFEVAGVHL